MKALPSSVAALLVTFSTCTGAAEVVVDLGDLRSITLTRAADDTDMKIDGKLDEPIWAGLPALTEFYVLEPDTLEPGKHETSVRLFYTSRGIYVGFDARQPPETLLKRLTGRDSYQVSRDECSITLDTSGSGRYGYWFNVGLGDSLGDGTLLPERQYSSTWDGAWRGASATSDVGWTAEMFIPWGTVSMPASGSTRRIGLYVSRKVAYLDERWGYPPLPPTKPKFISVLQPLEVEGVAPRQQYSLYPSAASTWDEVDNEMTHRIGGDVFWRPTTNSQLTATLNPDFGVVESDDVVVNLTATETFFPEKRLFFLEGQEIFVATPRAEPRSRDVGNTGSPYTMVNTRRIGGPPREPVLPPDTVLEDRELVRPVDLYGAIKSTGSAGPVRYGLLGAFEQDVEFDGQMGGQDVHMKEPGDSYGVARALYEDALGGAYRAVGFLSTAVVNPDRNAFTHGIDGHYLSSRGKLKFDGQMFTSDIDEIGRGYGGFLDMEYAIRQGVYQRVGIEYLDDTVDLNDLGFLERNDSLRLRSSHTRTTSNLSWAHENQFDARGFAQRNSDDLFTGGGLFLSDRLVLNDLSKITTRLGYLPKSYDDLNSFGNGTYRIEDRAQASIRWDTDPTRSWIFGIGGGFSGENLGGNTYIGEGQVDWRPNDRFAVSLAVVYQDRGGWLLHQSGTRMATYDAKQLQPKASIEYFINARQQFRASLQWVGIKATEEQVYTVPDQPRNLVAVTGDTGPARDFSLSNLAFQLRYRWEIAPLSDVFVVYTVLADQTRPLGDSDYDNLLHDAFEDPLANALVMKVRYRLGS